MNGSIGSPGLDPAPIYKLVPADEGFMVIVIVGSAFGICSIIENQRGSTSESIA